MILDIPCSEFPQMEGLTERGKKAQLLEALKEHGMTLPGFISTESLQSKDVYFLLCFENRKAPLRYEFVLSSDKFQKNCGAVVVGDTKEIIKTFSVGELIKEAQKIGKDIEIMVY